MCSINHEKKAIFIHVPKTAGTYITNILINNYGFEYYLLRRIDHEEYCDYDIKYNKNKYIDGFFFGNKKYGTLEYYMNSEELNKKMNMTLEKWNSYYKFSFVRNPYDRLISSWNYLQKILKLNIEFEVYLNFKEILSDIEYFHMYMPQFKNISNNNKLFVNYIGKYENLENNIKEILLNIGFKEEDINHKRIFYNKYEHKYYKEYINNQEILDKINVNIDDIDFTEFSYDRVLNINNF